MRAPLSTLARAAAGAAVLMVALTGCGGDDPAGGTGGGGTPVEAAEDPVETLRRIAPLAQRQDWEQACKLMADDDGTPYADYPDLLAEECVAEHAPDTLADLSAADWELMLDTPAERVEESSSGEGNPQLSFNDTSGGAAARAVYRVSDGRYYVFGVGVM